MSSTVADPEADHRKAHRAVATCRERIAHNQKQVSELGHLGGGAIDAAAAQLREDQAALPRLEIEERRLRGERDNMLELQAQERYAIEVKRRREQGRARLLFAMDVAARFAAEEGAKDRADYERGLPPRGVAFVVIGEAIARLREQLERIEGGAA